MIYHSVLSTKERGRVLVSIAGLTGVQEWVVNQQKRNFLLDLFAEKGMLRIREYLMGTDLKMLVLVGFEAQDVEDMPFREYQVRKH